MSTKNTFDVILFDGGAAVGRFLDVGTVALLVDDAPTWWPEERQSTPWIKWLIRGHPPDQPGPLSV